MPYLVNSYAHDIFAPQIHRNIPARDRIRITEDEAVLFEGNSVLKVERDKTVTGGAGGTRSTAKRGGKRAEVTGKPKRETR